MKTFKLNLEDIELIDALDQAAKSQARAATRFTPGSAAHTEITRRSAAYQEAVLHIKSGLATATPLESAIDKRK